MQLQNENKFIPNYFGVLQWSVFTFISQEFLFLFLIDILFLTEDKYYILHFFLPLFRPRAVGGIPMVVVQKKFPNFDPDRWFHSLESHITQAVTDPEKLWAFHTKPITGLKKTLWSQGQVLTKTLSSLVILSMQKTVVGKVITVANISQFIDLRVSQKLSSGMLFAKKYFPLNTLKHTKMGIWPSNTLPVGP